MGRDDQAVRGNLVGEILRREVASELTAPDQALLAAAGERFINSHAVTVLIRLPEIGPLIRPLETLRTRSSAAVDPPLNLIPVRGDEAGKFLLTVLSGNAISQKTPVPTPNARP